MRADTDNLYRRGAAVLMLAVFAASGCSRASTAAPTDEGEPRSFHLTAEDTHFVQGDEKDPKLVVEKGDRVRITFENTQSGVVHAISVPPFTEGVDEVKWGDTATVTFVASKTGTFEYTCPHHVPIMKGEFVVRPSSSSPSK